MMRPETVERQMLEVLRSFWERYGRGQPLQEALRAGARDVALATTVRHQTIIDGLTRRLEGDIGELYGLLKQWTQGDSGPLAAQLKAKSNRSAHESIDAFFESCTGNPARNGVRVDYSNREEKSERVCFDLSAMEARMLRAVAEINGVSEVEFVTQVVRTAVGTRMKAAADELMR